MCRRPQKQPRDCKQATRIASAGWCAWTISCRQQR
jgi:hypothetical protein